MPRPERLHTDLLRGWRSRVLGDSGTRGNGVQPGQQAGRLDLRSG